jgi:uncharacterized protein YprB with RNaseH-like and TPR domain
MAKKWTLKEDHLIQELYLTRQPCTIDQLHEVFDIGGYPRSRDALRNRAYRLRKGTNYAAYLRRQQWFEGAEFGYLDIETSAFKADWGYMLSWCIYYPHLNETAFGVLSRKDVLSYKLDQRITKELSKEIAANKCGFFVTYYGKGFDIPFIRTRCMKHKFWFPGWQERYHLDLYYKVKGNMSLGKKSLDNSTKFLGIEGKNHVEKAIWQKGTLGHKKSLEYILDHNRRDVEILKELHDELAPHFQLTRASI